MESVMELFGESCNRRGKTEARCRSAFYVVDKVSGESCWPNVWQRLSVAEVTS